MGYVAHKGTEFILNREYPLWYFEFTGFGKSSAHSLRKLTKLHSCTNYLNRFLGMIFNSSLTFLDNLEFSINILLTLVKLNVKVSAAHLGQHRGLLLKTLQLKVNRISDNGSSHYKLCIGLNRHSVRSPPPTPRPPKL